MARKAKLSKLETIERNIRLQLRRQERAIDMQKKGGRMLKLSAIALARLHKQKQREEAKNALVESTTQVESPPANVTRNESQSGDGLDIPKFMQRGAAAQQAADEAIAAETNRLNALPDPRTKEKKAERKVVEKEKREAELTGKRRKMPLSGKAALDAIRDKR